MYLFKPFIPITNGKSRILFCGRHLRIAEFGLAIADLNDIADCGLTIADWNDIADLRLRI